MTRYSLTIDNNGCDMEEDSDGMWVHVDDVKVMLKALNEIANWKEGPKVTPAFDNPRDAETARKAIKKVGG
jgi:hypothetical protein